MCDSVCEKTTTHLMDKATTSVRHPSSFFLELAIKFKARDINAIVAHRRIYSSGSRGRGVNSLFSLDFYDLYGKIK